MCFSVKFAKTLRTTSKTWTRTLDRDPEIPGPGH